MNRWTTEQQIHARQQGWDIFAIDGDQGRLAIQRLDDSGFLETDFDAVMLVSQLANDGDLVCRAALELVNMRPVSSHYIVLTPLFWDCECDQNYIHAVEVPWCPVCNAKQTEQPRSYAAEVLKYGFTAPRSEA